MAQMLSRALQLGCHTQAPTRVGLWRYCGSLVLLMWFVGVGPCQAQVVMETAAHEEDDGAGAGEIFKMALQANIQRNGPAASVHASRANAIEDATRGLKAPSDRILTESSVHEELIGEAAASQEDVDHQKVEMLPVVEMESSMWEEDGTSPVPYLWGRPEVNLRGLSDQGTTATETSTTTVTTITVTTTTRDGGNAPAAAPATYTTRVAYTAEFDSPPDSDVMTTTCDAFRVVLANRLGVALSSTSCTGTYQDGTGTFVVSSSSGRRLTTGTAQFDMTVITESAEEASRVGTEVSELEAGTITTDVVTEIQNDPTVPDAVKTAAATVAVTAVADVVTDRSPTVRAMRGGLTVTVGNAGYTNEQVIGFITEMLVQALADTANTNVNADNITVSVDSSTSIRFKILSYEAIEDLAILDALSQPDTTTVLQAILTESGVDITISGASVEWEISGTFVVESAAVDAADQQKLTNSSIFSTTSMLDSLSAYAQLEFPLTSLQVGVFLLDKIAYEEGVNTSNRLVVTYSYVPSTFDDYCSIAAQQDTTAQRAEMEAALSYTGVDATILPVFESFEQDPVLAACTAPVPAPTDDESTSTATAVIVLISVGVVLCVLGILLAAWFALRRRRTDDPSGPLTSDDQEAQRHGTVPESAIQVALPPADANGEVGPTPEAPESDVHRERGAGRHWDPTHWNAEEQFLEYLDDEPRV